jgi:FkbM family methyltransferase
MKRSLEEELDQLLGESREAAPKRAAAAFDQQAGPFAGSLVLFGAGRLGRKTLKGLRQAGIEPLTFVDNNTSLWHQKIDGVEVLPPDEAARRFGKQAAFVVTIWRAAGGHRFDKTRAQLQQLGCECTIPAVVLFWKYPEIFLDYYCLGQPHKVIEDRSAVRETFSWLADEISRREYVSQVRWRLHADFAVLSSPDSEEPYFPGRVFRLNGHEMFVDCGAFDGDSVDAFVRRTRQEFRQILALEPDPLNFKKMKERVAGYPAAVRRKIRMEQVGVADFNCTLRFDAEGSMSSATNPYGALEITCMTVDDLLQDTTPTYIKIDIEGAEPEALHGASRSIRRSAPILAVSAYHRPNHLWHIPGLVKSLREDYHLFLRPHNEDGWDTVCYAVPADRLSSPLISLANP